MKRGNSSLFSFSEKFVKNFTKNLDEVVPKIVNFFTKNLDDVRLKNIFQNFFEKGIDFSKKSDIIIIVKRKGTKNPSGGHP